MQEMDIKHIEKEIKTSFSFNISRHIFPSLYKLINSVKKSDTIYSNATDGETGVYKFSNNIHRTIPNKFGFEFVQFPFRDGASILP